MSKTDYLLPGSGKSRRSSNGFASFGIRASALDFPMEGLCGSGTVSNDLHKRLKERYQNYEEYELEWKRKIERAKKKREEKKRREQEEKENEIEKEKERKVKEEQEKESKKNLISNDFSSPIVELNFQELVEEIPKEASSNNFTSLKRKAIDIIPTTPLCIQSTFISQTPVRNEEMHLESYGLSTNNHDTCFDQSLVKEANENFIHCGAGLYLIEEQNFYVHFERITYEISQVVFDPGGHINRLDSRTNPFDEGGYDMNPRGVIASLQFPFLLIFK